MQDIEEIALFMMKEDIYWRRVWLLFLVDFSHFIVDNEHLFKLTDTERQNLERFK